LTPIPAFWKRASEWPVRELTLQKLERLQTPAGRDLFLNCVEDALDKSDRRPTGIVAQWKSVFSRPPAPQDEIRYASLVRRALTSKFDETSLGAFRGVVAGALDLPISKAARLLEEARSSLPPAFSKAAGAVLLKIQKGEARPHVLLETLESALPGNREQ
jgi:hypothetical protein